MTGIGIIALAGVVTNNNIVLIDTYDRLRREGVPVEEAILRTCRERARPVLLTAVTAILGVLPIAFGLNVDFVHREVTYGAPSTQWWIQLSTAIVFGLGFATILTLVVTPASLAGDRQAVGLLRPLPATEGQGRRRRRAGACAAPRGSGLSGFPLAGATFRNSCGSLVEFARLGQLPTQVERQREERVGGDALRRRPASR